MSAQTPRGAPVPGAPTGVIAFVNVGVVPMDTERVLANHTVLVEGGWITALGPANKIKVPAGATRIDGRGKYLLPGLSECHAHMAAKTEDAERSLIGLVASGVTTVRVMDYAVPAEGETILALRARAAAGELLSPRIYASGVWGRYDLQDSRRPRKDTRPEDVAGQITAYKAAGYDHIKYHWDLETRTPEGRAAWDSLAAAARRVGLPLVGHLPNFNAEPGGVVGWLDRNPGAVRSIEHTTGFVASVHAAVKAAGPDSAAIAAVLAPRVRAIAAATKRAGTWTCPTIAGTAGTEARLPSDDPVGALVYRLSVKALHEAGAGLLLGTDLGSMWLERYASGSNAEAPDEQLNQELRAFVAAGLTPYAALAAGTRNLAEYYGTLDSAGTVAVGKRADLVLLNGNPLADLRHQVRPAGVMLGGRWLARAELDRRLVALDRRLATRFPDAQP